MTIKEVEAGDRALADGDGPKAERLYLQALELYGNLWPAWYGLGLVYAGDEAHERARDTFAKAVQADPGQIEGWLGWIEALRCLAEDELAQKVLTDAMAHHPDDEALWLLYRARHEGSMPLESSAADILAALAAGDDDKALEILYNLENSSLQSPNLLIARAALFLQCQHGEALELIHALTQVVQQDPENALGQAALGRLLIEVGPLQNMRVGVAYCETAWRANPEDPRVCLYMAQAWAMTGQEVYARALCEKLIKEQNKIGDLAAVILADEDREGARIDPKEAS